jgi:hypothetical protein
MNNSELLSILINGANLHQSEHIEAAGYRAYPTNTEYLLTSALLRAASRFCSEVRVEALSKYVVNVMTSSTSSKNRKALGKQRFDILIGEYIKPEAIVEIKIGVRSGIKLFDDTDKLLNVISYLDRLSYSVPTALVYEIHFKGSGSLVTRNQFEARFNQVDTKVRSDIMEHLSNNWPLNVVSFHLLSSEITEADVSEGTIDEDGSATFIVAAIFDTQMNPTP